MKALKSGVKIKGKTAYDLEAVFVPPSLIDEWLHRKREQGSACEPAWCYGQ